MSEQIVKVPDLGGTDSVEVIEICVSLGDTVDEGQSLVVVESDKASMDIPSPFAGKVEKILVSEGQSISEDDALVALFSAGGESEDAKGTEEQPTASEDAVSEKSVEATTTEQTEASNLNEDDHSAAAQESNVVVPDLGGADSVEIIEVCVAVGDEVNEGDSILVLESDKASMDLPAPFAGKVAKVLVELGGSVSEGDSVLVLSTQVSKSAQASTASAAPVDAAVVSNAAVDTDKSQAAVEVASKHLQATPLTGGDSNKGSSGAAHAGPAVRKLARELGIELSKVTATGPKGRVAKEDLHAYVKEAVSKPAGGLALPSMPEIDFAKFGEIETVAMTKMQKVTATNMQRSWLTVPHVTHFDNADITELEKFRASLKPEMQVRGIKISPVAFVVKAVAASLKLNPLLNSSIGPDGESLVYKNYVHVGMAVDTEHGLFVPVIRNADKKGLWEIAEEITELASKARSRKLRPDDMQGASFTISSLGAIGGTGFTPIVNTPEVGILGVSNSTVSPVYIDGEFQPRTLLPLTLSYDHRVVNGGNAGQFMTTLTGLIADLRRALL